jgi:hypothetical protein
MGLIFFKNGCKKCFQIVAIKIDETKRTATDILPCNPMMLKQVQSEETANEFSVFENDFGNEILKREVLMSDIPIQGKANRPNLLFFRTPDIGKAANYQVYFRFTV